MSGNSDPADKSAARDAAAGFRFLKSKVDEACRRGAYAEAVMPAEEAMALARKGLGPGDPETPAAMKKLAFLYASKSCSRGAGALLLETLEVQRAPRGRGNLNTPPTLPRFG